MSLVRSVGLSSKFLREHRKPRILLVEDDGVLRDVLADFLTTAGYEVVQAADGVEALATLERASVDGIVTDLWMPNLDGVRLIQSVRERNPALPIVLMTAFPEDFLATPQPGGPNDRCVRKPFEAQDILDAVSSIVPLPPRKG